MNGSGRTVILGLAICAAACGGGGNSSYSTPTSSTPTNNTPTNTPAPAPNSVTATTGETFSPNTLTVAVGTSVSFVFQSLGHNVTFNPVAGAPPSILGTNSNTTIAVTFNTAGTFPYQCTIHPGMTGSVTVQ